MENLVKIYKNVFEPIKNSFIDSEKGTKPNKISDGLLEELGLEKTPQTRYIAYESNS